MTKKVLIAEDNDLNMQLFTDVVLLQGWRVIQAFDGPAALRLAAEFRPDIIVMDIQLPEISGLEVIRRLRADETLADIPILVVTAFAMRGDEERILLSGCDKVLTKPVTMSEFVSTLQYYMTHESKD